MVRLPRPAVVVWIAAALALALVATRLLHARGAPPPRAAATARSAPHVVVRDSAAEWVVVHVAGAVRRPGVYRLRSSQRVADAITRAGGPRRHADLDSLNLAAHLEDGRQVLVTRRGAATGAGGATGPVVPGGAAATPATPLDLNTATAEQLDTLDGIGPTTARKILAYRQQHGGFRSVDELDQVSGIGPKRLATLRPLVHT